MNICELQNWPHTFEYARDVNYYNGIGPTTIEVNGEVVDVEGEVLSVADQYRCIHCGLIMTIE